MRSENDVSHVILSMHEKLESTSTAENDHIGRHRVVGTYNSHMQINSN